MATENPEQYYYRICDWQEREVTIINCYTFFLRIFYLILQVSVIMILKKEEKGYFFQLPSYLILLQIITMVMRTLNASSFKKMLSIEIFYLLPFKAKESQYNLYISDQTLVLQHYEMNEFNQVVHCICSAFFLYYSLIVQEKELLYFAVFAFNSVFEFYLKLIRKCKVNQLALPLIINNLKSVLFRILLQGYIIQFIIYRQYWFAYVGLLALLIAIRRYQKKVIHKYSYEDSTYISFMIFKTLFGYHYKRDQSLSTLGASGYFSDIFKSYQVFILTFLAIVDLASQNNGTGIIRKIIQLLFLINLPFLYKSFKVSLKYFKLGPRVREYFFNNYDETEQFLSNVNSEKIKFTQQQTAIHLYSPQISISPEFLSNLTNLLFPQKDKDLKYLNGLAIFIINQKQKTILLDFDKKLLPLFRVLFQQIIKFNYLDYSIRIRTKEKEQFNQALHLLLEYDVLIPQVCLGTNHLRLKQFLREICKLIAYSQVIQPILCFSPKQIYYDLYD